MARSWWRWARCWSNCKSIPRRQHDRHGLGVRQGPGRPQEQGGADAGSEGSEEGVSGDALERGGGGGDPAQGFSGVLVWCAIGFPHKGGDRGVGEAVVLGLQVGGEAGCHAGLGVAAQAEGLHGVGLADGHVKEVARAVNTGEGNIGFGGGFVDKWFVRVQRRVRCIRPR